MKKSLSKVLARIAKDGDTEMVAEIIGEMIGSAEPEEAGPEPGEESAGTEPPVIENAENVIVEDEGGLGAVLERLDRIIALLEPAAADGEPCAAEPAGEAPETDAAEPDDPMAEEVSAVMEELLDPVASVILEAEEEEENELPETLQTEDALRAALSAVRPVLARMPGEMRRRMAGDIAARLRRTGRRGTDDPDIYAALSSAGRRTAPASAELGKRIMEKRNVSYRRG